MNRIMAIYDAAPFYAERLAEYANQKERIPFSAVSFSSAERLQRWLEQQQTEILLMGTGIKELDGYRKLVKQMITLNDGHPGEQTVECPTIYKYQSADNILREVMALCESDGRIPAGGGRKNLCTVAGVFSPVNRCGKTAFSLVYAQTLARESRTLYVNLEDCSGFSGILPQDGAGDFSDVLYYFRQELLGQAKLSSVIHSAGELDYIPPVRYPEDLYETSAEELVQVLRQMAAEGGYHTLVVDLGTLGKMAVKILEACDVIYMPVLEDVVSAAKVAEFEHYLELSQQILVAERIQKILLPMTRSAGSGSSWLEQLLWGEMGDYVRQLVQGGEGNWQH